MLVIHTIPIKILKLKLRDNRSIRRCFFLNLNYLTSKESLYILVLDRHHNNAYFRLFLQSQHFYFTRSVCYATTVLKTSEVTVTITACFLFLIGCIFLWQCLYKKFGSQLMSCVVLCITDYLAMEVSFHCVSVRGGLLFAKDTCWGLIACLC